MLGGIPQVEALVSRALQIDETWGDGTLQEFEITFGGSRPGGVNYGEVEKHYRRALDLSAGKRAGLHVAYAETAWLPRQKKAEFQALLEKALDVDPNGSEAQRLANAIARQKAEWLLERVDDLILEPAPSPEKEKLQ